VLSGRTIPWPAFDNVARPLLGLLGTTQATQPTDDEVGLRDAEALARQEREREQRSAELAGQYATRLREARTVAELQGIGGELTTAAKQRFAGKDLARVRRAYADRLADLKASDRTSGGTRHGA
jgi:hypothetical protein